MAGIKDGEGIYEAKDIPDGPHWVFLEFAKPNRTDSYGQTGPELDLRYTAFGDEALLKAYVARHVEKPHHAEFVVLRVEGKAQVERAVTISLSKPERLPICGAKTMGMKRCQLGVYHTGPCNEDP